MRQLQIYKLTGTCAGHVEKRGHTYFDTQHILNGKDTDSAFYIQPWLDRSVLGSTTSLDTSAKFFETLADTDAHSYEPSVSGSCNNQDFDQLNSAIMKLSLDQRECSRPANMMNPHNDTYLEVRNMCGKAHAKNMKRMLAAPCGDDAEAQVVRANKRFLTYYITAVTKRQHTEEASA